MLAPKLLEDGQLGLILDSFRRYGETEHLGQIQDRLDDGLVLLAMYQGLDEASVELHLVGGQVAQIGQGRVAGAKVVDGEQDTELLQLVHPGNALAAVFQHHGFGHLQQQAGGGNAGIAQYVLHLLHEALGMELAGADVDREVRDLEPLVEPEAVLGAGGFHYPVADLQNEAGLLGDGDELPRRHHGAIAALPAQQGLDAGEAAVVDPVLGLVVQQQLMVAQGIA